MSNLLFKQRVPFFSSVLSGSARLAGEVDSGACFKVVAIVGLVLILDPFRLSLAAFVVNGGIEKPAIPATVQVAVALRTGILFQNFLCGEQRNTMSTIEAGKGDIRHGGILA